MHPLPALEYSQRKVSVENSTMDSQLALRGETRIIWIYRPTNTSRSRRHLAFLHGAACRTGGQVGRSMLCPDTAGCFLSALGKSSIQLVLVPWWIRRLQNDWLKSHPPSGERSCIHESLLGKRRLTTTVTTSAHAETSYRHICSLSSCCNEVLRDSWGSLRSSHGQSTPRSSSASATSLALLLRVSLGYPVQASNKAEKATGRSWQGLNVRLRDTRY